MNAQGTYERKHPIVTPYKHRVTDLIIQQYHESLGHMGQILTRNILDNQRKISRLSEEKCTNRRAVHDKFT